MLRDLQSATGVASWAGLPVAIGCVIGVLSFVLHISFAASFSVPAGDDRPISRPKRPTRATTIGSASHISAKTTEKAGRGPVDEGTTGGGAKVRPTAVATWRFGEIAVKHAKVSLGDGGTALDALEAGITAMELDTKDQYFVGLGGLPNAEGLMELDAAVMDGNKMSCGAVMAIRGIVTAFSAARLVMERSPHSILAGEGATKFALANGLNLSETLTDDARQQFEEWRALQSRTDESGGEIEAEGDRGESHDTVGMICLDEHGNLAAGTSTSGWKFKHPGRVGDSPVVGSGLYCDARAGGAVATGDGEEILRTCLSFLVVEFMREGLSPTLACQKGIRRLKELVIMERPVEGVGPGSGEDSKDHMYNRLTVAVMAMSPSGEIGAASTLGPENVHRGRPVFPLAVWREGEDVRVIEENELPLSDKSRAGDLD